MFPVDAQNTAYPADPGAGRQSAPRHRRGVRRDAFALSLTISLHGFGALALAGTVARLCRDTRHQDTARESR